MRLSLLILLIPALSTANLRDKPKDDSASSLPKCLTYDYNEKFSQEYCKDIEKFYEDKTELSHDPIVEVDWSNIVIFMMIYKNTQVDELIEWHYKTWLQHTGEGIDIVFITDDSDTRSFDEILPHANLIKGKSHLYKSLSEDDGKKLRFKVIDSLAFLSYEFGNDDNKKYFIKMDSDTYILPENLLKFINKLHLTTKLLPVQFGKAVCARENMCYAGGALYGMNKEGLIATTKFILDHPNTYKEKHMSMWKADRNLMEHEDYMVSYAFRNATNYPVIHHPNIFNFEVEKSGLGSFEFPVISYHKLKSKDKFEKYEGYFYFRNGKIRHQTKINFQMPPKQRKK